MNTIQEIIAVLLMGCGLLFIVISAVGMLRLPDFYSRLHVSGNSETFGLMLSLLGLAVYEGFTLNAVKLILIFIFVFIGNPIGTHILSKAAYKTGHPMYRADSDEVKCEGCSQNASNCDINAGSCNIDFAAKLREAKGGTEDADTDN